MKISRRNFIKSTAAVGATSVAGLSNIKLANAATQDYKALICISLGGGNDAYNMVVPYDNEQYNQYQQIRNHLAIAHNELIPLGIKSSNNVELALHPSMQSFADIIRQENDASILVNTGQLVEPVVGKSSYQLPKALMSHNSQNEMWQTGTKEYDGDFGWAGRMVEEMNLPGTISPLMSLSGSNSALLNSATAKEQFVLTSNGAGNYLQMNTDKLDGMLFHMNQSYENIYVDNYAKVMSDRFHRNEELRTVLSNAPQVDGFPNSSIGRSLATVAKLIHSRSDEMMGHNRQVFFVSMGGFDTHTGQLNKHAGLLADLSDALAAFYYEIKQNGLSDNVTSFTMSDFGRRISPNEDGTDHGWGGHQLVMGGAVKGGQAYGSWPDLTLGGAYDYNNGRVIPEIAADQVNASLAKWFGYTQPAESLFSSLNNFSDKTIDFI